MLVHLWRRCHFSHDADKLFIRSVVLCAWSSFLFGWHVHEKAILLVILPLTALSMYTELEANIYVIVSITGYFSLFPLLHLVAETPTKVLLLIMFALYTGSGLKSIWCGENENNAKVPHLLNILEQLYLYGLVAVQVYYSCGHQLLGLDAKLPFLPLMTTSFYCAIGVIYTFFKYYAFVLRKCF